MPNVIRLSMYQAAAILGCFWEESKINPACWHYNAGTYEDTGYGLGMWTDYPLSNPPLIVGTAMKNWVTERYGYWYSGEGQVACLISDTLSVGSMWTRIPQYIGDPPRINPMYTQFSYLNTKYPNWTAFLNDTQNTDIEYLTNAFFIMWETPGTIENYWAYDNWPRRRASAYRIFDYLTVHGDDEISAWYYEDGYVFIPTQKAYDNCVLLWQQVGSGIVPPPGPGPHPDKKKGMPIWMMIRYR